MATTHLLTRAVISRGDRVLLVRADGNPHTFLPGGHVEDGEGLEECLRRELWEELGVESQVRQYLGVVEHRWHRDDTPQYELNHCFTVEAPGLESDAPPAAQEDYLQFQWSPLDALGEACLQPTPLRRLLAPPSSPTPWWASTLGATARPEVHDAS